MVAHQLSSMTLAESDFHVKKNNNNEQPLSCTHIIKRLETDTHDTPVVKWLKCQHYTRIVKRSKMSQFYTSA